MRIGTAIGFGGQELMKAEHTNAANLRRKLSGVAEPHGTNYLVLGCFRPAMTALAQLRGNDIRVRPRIGVLARQPPLLSTSSIQATVQELIPILVRIPRAMPVEPNAADVRR